MASIVNRGQRIEIRAYAGRDRVTGSVRNLYKSLPASATPEEVAALASDLQATADALRGSGVPFTLKGLIDFYLDSIETDHSPTYVDACRSNARCYLYPFIGSRRADTIRPFEFMQLYQRLMTDGGKDGNPVSPNTVRKLHSWLSPAFDSLVAIGAIQENPLASVKRPSPAPTGAKALSQDDLAKLYGYLSKALSKPETDPLDEAVFLDLHTGLRAGEIAALRCSDIINGSSVSVSRSIARSVKRGLIVKSTKGRRARVLSIPTDYAKRLSCAPFGWRGRVSDDTPIFPDASGSHRDPREFSRHFRVICDQVGIGKYAHFHTLRHTHATYLLRIGTPIRTVQDRLGHTSPSTTLGLYGHVLDGDDRQAAESFNDFFLTLSTDDHGSGN